MRVPEQGSHLQAKARGADVRYCLRLDGRAEAGAG